MRHRGALKSQPPGYSFKTDSYDMFQMIFVCAGELCFRDLECRDRTDALPQRILAPGDFLVLRYGSRFELASPVTGYGGICYLDYEPSDPRQCGRSFAFIGSDWLVGLAGSLQFALSFPDICAGETVALLGRAVSWHALDEEVPRPDAEPQPSRLWADRVRRVVGNTLYAEPDDFRRQIAALGLSYRQLARHFRADAGLSIKQYQIAERVREAKRLLANSGLSITQIAFELHYPSSQKFAAQFRRATGTSPGEFRAGGA